LADVVGSLSLATDLATGARLEHGLRRTLLAIWLAEDLGIDPPGLGDVYYVSLLGTVGCAIEGTVFATLGPDDIALSTKVATVDMGRPMEVAAFGLKNFGAGDPPLRRLRRVIAGATAGPAEFQEVCRDVALRVGDMLDIGDTIKQTLAQCHERWDGSGGPEGLQGEEIDIAARIFHVAHYVEVFNRVGGIDAAKGVARARSGKHFDAAIVERFLASADELLHRLESAPVWDAVLAAEPAPLRVLADHELEEIARGVAHFVDLRSPFTLGHSIEVATLAGDAARRMSLSDTEATDLHRAGLFHDLGRTGVPVAVWNKTNPWTEEERERAHSHPSLTELVLARSKALGHLGAMAGLHHERLDGSGYRGVEASFQPTAARILAAADLYRTKLERRPYRKAFRRDAAADVLRRRAAEGKLDGEVVEALLATAGHARPHVPGASADLTERELEVLNLLVRGMSNRQMAEVLVISPKTVGHHVQHIYDKLEVSTRVGATLFALQNGLVGETD
jgi:HD-GYP domain-containing protein (c-di-GMP phosphodiesterase class II)